MESNDRPYLERIQHVEEDYTAILMSWKGLGLFYYMSAPDNI